MAVYAQGTLLQMGDGASPTEAFTTIAEVMTITGPSFSRDTIDTTSHDTSNGFRTFMGGLVDAGEVSFDIQFDAAATTHIDTSGLLSKLVGSSLPTSTTNFRIVYPNSKRWNFAGIVSGFEVTADMGDKMQASVTIKISGKPTLTATA